MRTPWHINFYHHRQFLIQTNQQRRKFSHGSNGFTYFMLEKIKSWKTLIHDIQVRYQISKYKDNIQKVWQMIWNYEKYTIIETLKDVWNTLDQWIVAKRVERTSFKQQYCKIEEILFVCTVSLNLLCWKQTRRDPDWLVYW